MKNALAFFLLGSCLVSPAAMAEMQVIYQDYSPTLRDHILVRTTVPPRGYVAGALAFGLSASALDGPPLYECPLAGGHHAPSVRPCAGGILLGYMPQTGRTIEPLYRMTNDEGDYYVTYNDSDIFRAISLGFRFERRLGYVYPVNR